MDSLPWAPEFTKFSYPWCSAARASRARAPLSNETLNWGISRCATATQGNLRCENSHKLSTRCEKVSIYSPCCSDWDFGGRPNPLEIAHLFQKRWLDFSCSVFARVCEEYKHLADSTNLGLVYAISCSFLSLWLLCKQHLNHRNLRVDLGRDKCWSVFSPSQNSEFCTITLPPQQANKQRMRLKMCSNPKVDEGGQHPITGDRYEGSNPNDFFSLGV